jgi:hypothetical protein
VKKRVRAIIPAAILLFLATPFAAQKVETIDGGRIVHNEKGGLWGKAPRVALELVRKIGDIDTEDEHLTYHQPKDVAVDGSGNIYVLDAGNSRIQKFDPDGKYLATIGRKGQGPGEFIAPDAIDFDKDGNLVVADSIQARIHVIIDGGKDVRSSIIKGNIYGLRSRASGGFVARASTYSLPMRNQPAKKAGEMRLFRTIAQDGGITGAFGELTDFGEILTNAFGNESEFDLDAGDSLYVSFRAQNRIDKYGPDGKLKWRADRPLNYSTGVKKKGRVVTSGDMPGPEMNFCSKGIAVDGQGRAWVVTPSRQLKKEEEVQTSMVVGEGPGGKSSGVAYFTKGNTDLRTTDAFKMEIFADDGVLLGEIPLTHFVDTIRIFGDRLFLIDSQRGVTVYQYRILER